MNIKKEKITAKEESVMDTTMECRPCSISESLLQSCKEVKLMREGKSPKRNLEDLFSNINEWSKGDAES